MTMAIFLLCPARRTRGHGSRHISIKVPERRAAEVDQRPETQTQQVCKTILQCDVTMSCKLVRFYYTMSPYTWKNDVCLTGMIAIFIRFCHQFIHSIPFKFGSRLANYFYLKPGSHMSPIYLEHSRRHSLGQHCICERLSPTHNFSWVLTAGLLAKLS